MVIRSAQVFLSVILVAGVTAVSAQDFPSKPIRIVTAGAGGSSDIMARQIAQGISGPLGQPVIVDNRGGVVTAEVVMKSPPDGYTVSLSGAQLWVSPLLQKMPYDVNRDFTPVTLATRDAAVLTVHPSLPVKSVQEFIAFAKARPGQLNYPSTGVGGAGHLAMELFRSMTGVNVVHVVYKGNPAAITALISGEMQVAIIDTGLVLPQAKLGKLRALAISTATPSALAPELPTIAASGLPGYEAIGVTGMFAPAKTPAPIVNRLSQEVVRFLVRPEVKERFLTIGSEVVASSPEQFAAALQADIAKWSKVIKEGNIKVE